MIYAPVFIPTLNRYEHLRKCLESLSKCTWADKTEVYVALDYPPLDKWEKYAPGWEKNRDWLRSIGDFGFKKLHLIEREENYGTWMKGDKGNLNHLIADNLQDRDRYIVSEDDNVFSPAFLEYMDKGLEMFNDEDDVIGITAYKLYMPDLKFDNNNYVRDSLQYNAWGVGTWKKKKKDLPCLDYLWFRKHLTFRNVRKVWKKAGMGAVCQFINLSCARSRKPGIDVDLEFYLTLTDKQQIFPKQTLVKNIGLDGSGVTMGDRRGEDWTDDSLNPLFPNEHFSFEGTGYEYSEENKKVIVSTRYFYSKRKYCIVLMKKIVKLIIHWCR